jgi:hypothetical protein
VADYSIPPSIDRELPTAVRRSLASSGAGTQEDFLSEYLRTKRSLGVAYLLWLLLGWHYAYVGRWGIQILYWITAGGLLLWALADLFRMPSIVRTFNQDKAVEAMRNVKMLHQGQGAT